MKSKVLTFLLLTSLIPPGHAEDARSIMQNVMDRNDGKTQVSRQKLSTCRYAKKDKRLVCAEKPRSKTIESVRKDYGKNEKDKKSVSVLTNPPGERGIGFLQYDYDERDKDADQWMYFSALGKVKRIISGNDDEPKEGSFFGSEFNYEDMEQPHIDDYQYKILKSETYMKRDCWVIEVEPTPERARKSNYSKSVSWIDKERLLSLKTIAHDRQGQKLKRITARKISQVDGIWIPLLLNVNNLQTKRMSTVKIEKIAFDVEVEDEFLTLRTLTDGAFRESRLQQYRSHIK